MGLHMVETKEIQDIGKERVDLPLEEDETLLLGKDWHRVCAPEETDGKKTHSLVFWHQSSPEEKPSWDKVVSGLCCYVGSTRNIGSLNLY